MLWESKLCCGNHVCLPVSLLQETLVLVQRRVYNTMTSSLFQSTHFIAFGIQEAAWTSREHGFLETRSMPQASLREYFLKHYKGGGVFKHDAYKHNADEWCWIHKSSGIKARPSPLDAFRVVTQFYQLQIPTNPQRQLLAGVAGCPGPHTVWWNWRSRVPLSLHHPDWL